MSLGASIGLALVLVAADVGLPAAQGQPGAAARTIVVISDLHMGEGRSSSGAWQPREDFRWSQEFARFLQAVDTDGRSAVDLILNGDTFELLESTNGACTALAGCTEPEMLGRLNRVLAAHEADIKSLGRFAASGSNRVILVPGDHDAALLFSALRRRAIEAFAAPGRVEVASTGRWVSQDRRVAAEHGHQVGLSVQKLENWPAPFVTDQGRELLATSPGEVVLQGLYRRLEERYPIVDNMAVSGVGLKYAVAGGGLEAAMIAPVLRAQLLSTPWQQFRMELDDGEVEPPAWDLAQVRGQGAAFFVTSLPDDDPFKSVVAGASASGALGTLLEQWSNDELAAVCDYRAAVRRARRRFEPLVTQFAPRGPAVTECPRTPETRGAQFDYFWRSRDETFGRHLKALDAQPGGRSPDVFVHGHTHLPDRSQNNANMISGGLLKIPMEGFSPVRGALLPIVINSGAWQRTITPVQYERLRATRSVSDDVLLGSLLPEDLPPCYSFVRIAPYTDAPSPAVRYWRQQTGSDWRIAETCGAP